MADDVTFLGLEVVDPANPVQLLMAFGCQRPHRFKANTSQKCECGYKVGLGIHWTSGAG